jgi:hypothetical protein
VTPLLSAAYLPPISYMNECLGSGQIILEQHEHYIKQTYRNRANVYGANGLLPLVIPVHHDNLFRIPIREVKISYESPWQNIHWRSITSAYRNSPYFEFLEDTIAPFYSKRIETLFEFNLELLKTIFSLMKADIQISFTSQYEATPANARDLRNSFLPNKRDANQLPYRQVFTERHGFLSDLSIIDRIFNQS